MSEGYKGRVGGGESGVGDEASLGWDNNNYHYCRKPAIFHLIYLHLKQNT